MFLFFKEELSVKCTKNILKKGGLLFFLWGNTLCFGESEGPEEKKRSETFYGSEDIRFWQIPPQTRTKLGVGPAGYLPEASLQCGYRDCRFGLSWNIYVGAHLADWMEWGLYPSSQENLKRTFFDGFIGYQYLNDVEGKHDAKGFFGFEKFLWSFDKDDVKSLNRWRFHFQYAYLLEQGRNFSFTVEGRSSFMSDEVGLEGIEKNIMELVKFSRKHPSFLFSVQVEQELMNWSQQQNEIAHMRLYGILEPFYEYASFSITKDILWTEQGGGVRGWLYFSMHGSSPKNSRFVVDLGIGMHLRSSSQKMKDLKIPKNEPSLGFVPSVQFLWQF